ncbi:MAG: GIY-YIG nuclease family protein [Anaerolineae bacterium]|nr:GIY-YIG nuclease family protein [Anaerolineae bacterium]
MAWMYILECIDGSYYVGSTKDIKRRLNEHQEGKGARYTIRRLPVKLVYSEEYERIADAFYREKQVQGWRREKKEALINGSPELLPALAKKIFDKSEIKRKLGG